MDDNPSIEYEIKCCMLGIAEARDECDFPLVEIMQDHLRMLRREQRNERAALMAAIADEDLKRTAAGRDYLARFYAR